MSIPQPKESLHGALLVLGGASFWGVCFLAAKLGGSTLHPIVLTWWVSALAAVIAWCVPGSSVRALTLQLRKHTFDYCGIALTGMVLGNILLYVALARLDLTLASLLERSQPVFVVLLSRVWLNERLNARTAWYCFLALIGATLLVLREPSSFSFSVLDPWGLAAILGTGFVWAVSTIFGKRLADQNLSARDMSVIRFVLGAVLLGPALPLCLPLGALVPSVNLLLTAGTIALLGVAGFLLYYRGLRHVSANRSAFLELTQPLVGVLLGVCVLGESLTLLQLAAIPLLLYSVAKLAQGV